MTEIDATERRRLNPFVFPSETNVRFTLLVVAALALATYGGGLLGVFTGLVIPDIPDIPNLSDPTAIQQGIMQWSRTLRQLTMLAVLPGVLMLSVLILAAIIYRSYPGYIRRNRGLRPVARGDDDQLVDGIQELVGLSGISPAPSIEMAAGLRSVDAQAFGLRNHYALRLGGRLRLLLRQSPDSFRAIILHELAHIANADVSHTYFAQAIWITVVILAVIPGMAFVIFSFAQGLTGRLAGGLINKEWIVHFFTVNVPTVLLVLFQFGGMLAVIAAIRSSLLRTREVYADWRAATWGAEAALSQILRHNATEDKTGRFTRLWRLHPSSQERLAALQHPEHLFRATAEVPFFVGVLLAYVSIGMFALGLVLMEIARVGSIVATLQLVRILDNMWIPYLVSSALPALTMAMVLALGFRVVYWVTGALGLEMQREAVAEMSINQGSWARYFKLWRPAALVGIGFQMGVLLTPFSFLALLPDWIGTFVLPMLLLSIVAVAGLTWAWLVYIRFFARRLLGSHFGALPPQGMRRLLTLAGSGLLLVLYLPAATIQVIVFALAALAVKSTAAPAVLPQLWTFLFVSIVAALFLYIVIFGVTWLLVQAYQLVRRPHCPTCKQPTRQRYAVGQICEHCGQNLAPWLFVD